MFMDDFRAQQRANHVCLQALASMGAEDPKPTCTMSRSHGNGMVATGGRAIRFRRR